MQFSLRALNSSKFSIKNEPQFWTWIFQIRTTKWRLWYRCTFNCLVVLRNKHHYRRSKWSTKSTQFKKKKKECKHFWRFFFIWVTKWFFPFSSRRFSSDRGMCGDESTSFMPPENRYSIVGIGVNSKTEA